MIICQNCGAVVGQRYCGACGQKHVPDGLSLRHLLAELADLLFDWDSKLWATVRGLAINPGQVALDYAAGKRARFVGPVRYCVMLLAAYVTAAYATGFLDTAFAPLEKSGVEGEAAAFMNRLFLLVSTQYNLVSMAAVPFAGWLLWLPFRRRHSYVATLCYVLYFSGQTYLYAMPFILAHAWFGDFNGVPENILQTWPLLHASYVFLSDGGVVRRLVSTLYALIIYTVGVTVAIVGGGLVLYLLGL